MRKPLDHPTPDRPHRIYFSLTNHCNRACPWCSTCSSPRGDTWLDLKNYASHFPKQGLFQVQLEGGEPTLHPRFHQFVDIARTNPRCSHLVVCTNGVSLPRQPDKLKSWIDRLGLPLTIKLSINHYLLDRDPGLIELAMLLKEISARIGDEMSLVINVRLRRGFDHDDINVREAIERAGLTSQANIFFLQRYGFASEIESWDPPVLVWSNFSLINPDGQIYHQDLLARSEGMRALK